MISGSILITIAIAVFLWLFIDWSHLHEDTKQIFTWFVFALFIFTGVKTGIKEAHKEIKLIEKEMKNEK